MIPSASPGSSVQIEVEIFGALLVVDVYTCLEENFTSVKAVGYPIVILQVIPQYVYATIEGEFLSILTTRHPECVRIRYASEAQYAEKALRISYSGKVSRFSVLMNFSNTVLVSIAPEPDDIYVEKENLVKMVWLDVEKVSVDYTIFEYKPAVPELTTVVTDHLEEPTTTQQQTTSQRPRETPGLTTSKAFPAEEHRRLLTVLIGLAVALAVIVAISKSKR